jgi:hypothetical protein
VANKSQHQNKENIPTSKHVFGEYVYLIAQMAMGNSSTCSASVNYAPKSVLSVTRLLFGVDENCAGLAANQQDGLG